MGWAVRIHSDIHRWAWIVYAPGRQIDPCDGFDGGKKISVLRELNYILLANLPGDNAAFRHVDQDAPQLVEDQQWTLASVPFDDEVHLKLYDHLTGYIPSVRQIVGSRRRDRLSSGWVRILDKLTWCIPHEILAILNRVWILLSYPKSLRRRLLRSPHQSPRLFPPQMPPTVVAPHSRKLTTTVTRMTEQEKK